MGTPEQYMDMGTSALAQGRVGEASITAAFVKAGYDVFLPVYGNTFCDMVVYKDGVVSRVECKSTRVQAPSGKFVVQLRQIRFNTKSTNIKKFDATNSEILAVYIVLEDRVVMLESASLHGRSQVSVN